MYGYLAAAIGGVLWANTRKPKTRVTRSVVMGPRSGHRWEVEYLEDLAVMVVIHPSAKVAFRKTADGWRLARSSGDPRAIEIVKKDFE
jgi:hypothetical protein